MSTERKRALISDKEQLAIANYVASFPDMQRTALAEKILAEVKWPGKPPEIEVLERKISLLRNHPIDDKPWSMATLDENPIPPEAIPAVLEVWKFRVARDEVFTIREAKWVARLSAKVKDKDKYPRKLSKYASQYARLELIYQLIGRPFDSTRIDRELMGIPLTI
jgi:hypothetical protein